VASSVLITSHHQTALAAACERGFWMPVPLSTDQAFGLSHLIVLSPGQQWIEEIGVISDLEPWVEADGIERWLPFLSQRRRLRHPIPLGQSRLLQGWLPRNYEEQRLLDLDALLAADSLAELLRVMMRGEAPRDRPVPAPAA
jgi:hypothetical protein